MANLSDISDKRMYVIYRSRFQPEFTDVHSRAVKKFFLLKEHLPPEQRLVLGIVDEHLFLNLYDQVKLEKSLKEVMMRKLGKSYDAYRHRFDPALNPSSIGTITKTIWEKWKDLQPSEIVPYTLLCSAAATGLSLYEEACEHVIRWLPETDAKQIGWYFPIFDRDDLIDLGLISSLLADYFGDEKRDQNRVVFARFKYIVDSPFMHLDKGHRYGFYLRAVAEKQTGLNFTKDRDSFRGMEIPSSHRIPFVYSWSESIELLQKIRDLLTWCQQTTLNVDTPSLKRIENDVDGLVERIKDPSCPYADDLEAFFEFLQNLGVRLLGCRLEEKAQNSFRNLVQSIMAKHTEDTTEWLETSIDSGQRVKTIGAKVTEIKGGR